MSADHGSRPMRLAFIGCGVVARKHSRRLRRFGTAVQCSYASRSPDKAAEVCRTLDGTASYGNYRAAIESPDVDVVFITTPPHLHLQWTLAALEGGKDVIVEKPAFPRVEAFDRVERASSASGRRVFFAENYYYKPLARLLRRLLADRAIGDALFVQLHATKRQRNDDWREDAALTGGGALLEGGIHWVNLMANLGLTVQSVTGQMPRPSRDPERSMLLTVRYHEGAVGTLMHSWEVPAPLGGLRLSKISGREGSITFESNGVFVYCSGPRRRLYLPGLRDIGGFRAMFSDIIDAWRTGRPASLTLKQVRRDVELIEQAHASAGQPLPPLRGSEGQTESTRGENALAFDAPVASATERAL